MREGVYDGQGDQSCRSLFGLAVLIGITWLFSNNKRAVDWKL
ncbi:Na+ dependent nucleoside transporter N-terminal domain-containing protein, partial [Stenotrophomonas muris]